MEKEAWEYVDIVICCNDDFGVWQIAYMGNKGSIVLIGLACTGMIYIALVVLVVCGVATLIGSIN
jgi:hypothetical protein